MMDDYFNDLPSALNILKDKSRYDIGSNGICNDINKYYIMLDDLNIWYNNRYNMIYIPRLTVIEGLDGSGKSTIVSQIANVLDIIPKSTPTKSLHFVRDYIDGHNDAIIRRAFYMMSNYMLVKEMTEECNNVCKNLHFVIDRYHHCHHHHHHHHQHHHHHHQHHHQHHQHHQHYQQQQQQQHHHHHHHHHHRHHYC